eukprot:1821309-Amphidinium_carterae.1
MSFHKVLLIDMTAQRLTTRTRPIQEPSDTLLPPQKAHTWPYALWLLRVPLHEGLVAESIWTGPPLNARRPFHKLHYRS